MEELNKTQIILLAIFITFVTSVATGVVVVTLLDQAPQGITQTVNRVVERTVEKVVSPGQVERTEVKQIVREDDTVVSSVQTAKQALVKVVRQGATSDVGLSNPELQTASFYSTFALSEDVSRVGFVVSGDGLVISSNELLGGLGSVYFALSGDTKYNLKFIKSDDKAGIALFSIENPPKNLVSLNALSIDQVSLGQTVMTLGFDSGMNTLAMGYISGLKTGNASTTPVIKTSIRPTENWNGRPLIDINGFLIGMYGGDNEIIPYITIKNLIDSSSPKPAAASPVSTKGAQ
ncbi:MAG TPA: serine protease [Candidatus Paceibacterota bacterium]|nr:serine protease [Candidatus Paceibacterota bacterium]